MRVSVETGDQFEHDEYGDVIFRRLIARYGKFEACDETPDGSVINGGSDGDVRETVVFIDDRRVEHSEPLDDFAAATGLLSD